MKPPRLAMIQEQPASAKPLPADTDARLEALRDVLLREAEFALQLREELLRQRAAVAGGDTAAVDRSSEATSRLLLSLEETKLRRGDVVASLTGDAEVPLDHLEAQLGHPLPVALESARLTLRRAATDVSREASINRVVLRRAVEAGETFLQNLFSGEAPQATYGDAAPPTPPSPAGRILDRTA